MTDPDRVEEFRNHVEKTYQRHPTGCGGSFGEILCYEIHHGGPWDVGLTFKELAQKWGISVSFLGELIADHCRKMED